MHVHQMRDELCVGGKARMFAEMTAERHGVRAGERNDRSMKKQNLGLEFDSNMYLRTLLGSLSLLPCLDFTHTW